MASTNPPLVNLARHQLQATIATAKKLGYYNLECEARLALAELGLRSNRLSGQNELAALAAEAKLHGMNLIAQRAEQAAGIENVVALNKSAKQ
jgi:hypothetical protein